MAGDAKRYRLSVRQHRLVRLAGLLAGLVGLVLLFIGVGTAVDYLVAQSHPVPPLEAFSLRWTYSVTGLVLVVIGSGVWLWSSLGRM